MNYVLEILSVQDQGAVVRDAGQEFGRLYAARGGYFRPGVPYEWVVDRDAGVYLIDAPIRSERKDNSLIFHFYFASTMYSVQLVGALRRTIQISATPPEVQRVAFETSLVQSLEVLGYRYAHFLNQDEPGAQSA